MHKKVLIVDDAAFMRMMLKNIMEKYDIEVVGEAENGQQAIYKYRNLCPDIVTMDITMPEMDGLEATREIIKNYPHAKIIICSAMGQSTMVIEAIRAGAKEFIVKPFKEDLVIQKIRRVME